MKTNTRQSRSTIAPQHVNSYFKARQSLAAQITNGLLAAMAKHPELADVVHYGSIGEIDEALYELGLDQLVIAQRSLASFDQDWLDDQLA